MQGTDGVPGVPHALREHAMFDESRCIDWRFPGELDHMGSHRSKLFVLFPSHFPPQKEITFGVRVRAGECEFRNAVRHARIDGVHAVNQYLQELPSDSNWPSSGERKRIALLPVLGRWIIMVPPTGLRVHGSKMVCLIA